MSSPDILPVEEALPQKSQKKQQHRWNEEKTLKLLQIVDIHRPFEAQHGAVTGAWEKVTKEYNGDINKQDASMRRQPATITRLLSRNTACVDDGDSRGRAGEQGINHVSRLQGE